MKNIDTLVTDIILPRLEEAPEKIFTKIKPKCKILNKSPFIIDKFLHNSLFT